MPEQQRPDVLEAAENESPARRPLEPARQPETLPQTGNPEQPRAVITPGVTRRLQRSAGNRAVATLLRQTDQDAGPRPDGREQDAPTGDRTAGRAGGTGPGGTRSLAVAAPPESGPRGDGPVGTRTAGAETGSNGPAPGPAVVPAAEQTGGELASAPGTVRGDAGPQSDAPGAAGGESDATGVLAGALATLHRKRAGVVEGAARRRARIEQVARAYRESVGRSFTTQAQNVGREYDATIEQINRELADRIQQVRSAETEHLAQAAADAGTERDELSGLTRARTASLDDSARTNAGQVRDTAASEATRAVAGGEERARRAAEMVDERAGPAAGNEGTAQFIREVRGRRLPQVQQRLRTSAQEVATGVRQQGADVAGHITGEAVDGRRELTGFFVRATNAVGDSHTETTRAIREAATAAVTSLQDAVRAVTTRLARDRDAKVRELRSGEAAMASAIDQQVTDTLGRFDQATRRDLAELDWAIERVHEGGGDPDSTNQAVSDIAAEIDRADGEHQSTAEQFATSVDQAATEADTQVATRAAQVTSGLATVRQELGGRLTQSVDTARREMGRVLGEGTAQMRAPRREADTASATAVRDTAAGWARRVEDERGRMAGQVDDGLARQDTQLTKFGADLDGALREARTSSSEGGFLSSVGSFFSNLGDFLLGVLEGVGLAVLDLLKGLWTLVTTVVGWVIIAVVVIVAVVVVVLFGWEALLVGLLVIGLVVGLSMGAYYVYLAITQPNLTWRERGRLVGRALFEFALAALSAAELRGLTSITKLGLVAQLARRLGGLGEAVRAIRVLGSVERALLILDRVGDAGLAMRLINSVRRFEDIVRLLDELGTAARVLELIGNFGSARALLAALDALGSGARLEACATAFGGAARLAEVMRAVGGADRFARYLGQLGDDVGRLAALVNDVGGAPAFTRYVRALGDDAARLAGLVNDVGGAPAFLRDVRALGDDAARLRRLVDGCRSAEDFRALRRAVGDDVVRLETMLRNAGDDPALLMDLLTQPGAATVDDIARLLELAARDTAALARLRGHVPDLARLVRYMEQAGAGNAGALADLMDLAVARGFPVERIERMLALANGVPAEFRRLAQALNRFPFPMPGAAPNAPVPTSIATGRFSIGAARIVMHRMSHYLERHVDLFFRFTAGNMNVDNTLWPPGTSAGDVATFLDEALGLLQAQGRLTASNLGQFLEVTLGNGVTARVMVDSVGGNLSVVSFHPVRGPGVVNFVLDEMRAFRALITGVQ